jgi:cell division protein FtsN
VRVEAVSPANRMQIAEKPVTPPVEQRLAAAAPTVAVDVDAIDAPEGYIETPRHATPVSLPAPAPAPTGQPLLMFIQAGAFTVPGNATRLGQQIAARGPVRIVAEATGAESAVYRVQLGPYWDVEAADHALRALIRDGFTDAILVVD